MNVNIGCRSHADQVDGHGKKAGRDSTKGQKTNGER